MKTELMLLTAEIKISITCGYNSARRKLPDLKCPTEKLLAKNFRREVT